MRTLIILIGAHLLLAPLSLHSQNKPRTLTAQEAQALRGEVAGNRASVEAAARAAAANQHALGQARQVPVDEGQYEQDDPEPMAPTPGFADILAHGMGVFRDEMAKKDQEQAAMQDNLDRIRTQAEAADRERQQRARAAQAQMAAQRAASQAQGAPPSAARLDRDRQLQAQVAAERERMAAAKRSAQVSERAAERPAQSSEQKRLSDEKAADERRRLAEADGLEKIRQAEQAVRSSFGGRATTCIGGGKDVLYLQSPKPSRTGCNASFEARCPGTPAGAGVHFSQANYIGSSCMGIGDSTRIGTMACAAAQVEIRMTDVDCGSEG